MNWNRCSKVAAAFAVVALVVAAPAAAVEATADDVPDESEVGTDASATVELTALYADYDSWTLHGETNLTSVTWTVVEYNAADDQIDQQSYNGQSFDHPVDIDDDTIRIEVRVEGTTPPVENPRYEPPQSTTLARLQQVRQGGTSRTIAEYGVHHYTPDSADARAAIDDAAAVVDGSGSDRAAEILQNAIEAYDDGSYAAATDLAEEAENRASEARQSRQTTRTLLFGGLALVVLVVLGTGIYYWNSRRDDYDTLR